MGKSREQYEQEAYEFNSALGKSPDIWKGLSNILLHASEELDAKWRLAHKRKNRYFTKLAKGMALSEKERGRFDALGLECQFNRVCEMLRAMSLENELKSAVYRRKVAAAGHIDDVEFDMRHDFVKLAEAAGATLTDDDKHNLRWQQGMLQLGRYPVAFHPKQKHLATSFTTSREHALKLRARIIAMIDG